MFRSQLFFVVVLACVSLIFASGDIDDESQSENLVSKMSIRNLLDDENTTTVIVDGQGISVSNGTIDFPLPVASHQVEDTTAEGIDGFERQFYQNATRLGSYTMMACVGLACVLFLLCMTNCFLCFAFWLGYGKTASYELPK